LLFLAAICPHIAPFLENQIKNPEAEATGVKPCPSYVFSKNEPRKASD
jgi:hypothetical protein